MRLVAVTLWLFAAVALLHGVESNPSALDKLLVETIEELLQQEAKQEIAQDENKHGEIHSLICNCIKFCLHSYHCYYYT